jgi:hypothetical protein
VLVSVLSNLILSEVNSGTVNVRVGSFVWQSEGIDDSNRHMTPAKNAERDGFDRILTMPFSSCSDSSLFTHSSFQLWDRVRGLGHLVEVLSHFESQAWKSLEQDWQLLGTHQGYAVKISTRCHSSATSEIFLLKRQQQLS